MCACARGSVRRRPLWRLTSICVLPADTAPSCDEDEEPWVVSLAAFPKCALCHCVSWCQRSCGTKMSGEEVTEVQDNREKIGTSARRYARYAVSGRTTNTHSRTSPKDSNGQLPLRRRPDQQTRRRYLPLPHTTRPRFSGRCPECEFSEQLQRRMTPTPRGYQSQSRAIDTPLEPLQRHMTPMNSNAHSEVKEPLRPWRPGGLRAWRTLGGRGDGPVEVARLPLDGAK